MIARGETEFLRLAPAPDLGVVIFRVACGHVIRKEVGQAQLDVPQLGLDVLQRVFACLKSVPEILDSRQQRLDVLALRLGLADALGARVALALQLFRLHLQRFAAFLERKVRIGVERDAAPGEIGGDVGCRMAQ